MDLGLKDKVALVTGAGRGCGQTISITLAREGVKVGVNDYYLDRAEAVAKEIKDKGGEAIPLQADVTNRDQVEQIVKRLVDTHGQIDILVNNAGIPAGMLETEGMMALAPLFHQTDRDTWEKWVNLDFFGNLTCDRVVAPYMIDQKYGRIVSIISDAGRIGEPRQAVYSGAKGGIVAFNKALAKELARYGITVNCVASSAMEDTYLLGLMGGAEPKDEEAKKRREAMMRLYPLARAYNRLGLTSDIANAAVFLASDVAAFITGQVLSVNGGYSMVD